MNTERQSAHNLDSKVAGIFTDICNLTVTQIYQLSEAFREKFNLPAMGAASFGGGTNASVQQGSSSSTDEEKDAFDVILKSVGGAKVAVIKVIKEALGKSLIEAKQIAETPNALLKHGVTKEEAEKVKTAIDAAGGEVEIK